MRLDRVIAVRTSKTVYRDGQSCIKLFVNGKTKAEVFAEALNHAQIEELGIVTPSLRSVCDFDGRWAIVTDYVPGKTLERLLAESPDLRDELLDIFVNTHVSIVTKRSPELGSFKDYINKKLISAELGDSTTQKLLASLDALPDGDTLCHGDFNLSNVVMKDRKTPYILDWVRAASGHPSADAAMTCLLFRLRGLSSLEDYYVSRFTSLTGVDRALIEAYIPPIAGALICDSNADARAILRKLI